MRGDIDGDGKITENDRNRISEHLGGTITLTGADSWCAKVTGNNEISVSDLVQLVQYLEGKTNNLTGIPTFADYYNNWTYHKVDDLTGYWTAEVVINGLKTTSDAIVNISNDEGIFYKSELSDGAISFYATRPPIAEVPATITFKPGTGVITTSYESAKFHAATHSKDGADPIIPESIGALSLSGGTMTGSLILKDNPAKDLEAATKQYVDNHTSDAVLYTPQSLTDGQKTQARGNIGAAPSGGGVMEATIEVSASSASESYDTFCAKLDKILATMPDGSVKFLRVYPPQYYTYGIDMCALYKSGINYASVYTIGSYNYGRQGFRMVKRKLYSSDPTGQWDPLEYINPEMKLGVEYRTTERYLGKPVYVKLVNAGTMPTANTAKLVAHGIANVGNCLRCNATWSGIVSFPYRFLGTVTLDRTNITLDSGTQVDYPNGSVLVTMYYTKTTD